jgi:hypothetical protein
MKAAASTASRFPVAPIHDAQSCESRAHQFFERDWRRSGPWTACGESSPLAAMSFVLTPARADGLLRPSRTSSRRRKSSSTATLPPPNTSIRSLENERSPLAKITDRAFRAVGETKRYQNIVAAVATGICERAGIDLDDWRASKKHQQIHKVANLAANAAAALLADRSPNGRGEDPALMR